MSRYNRIGQSSLITIGSYERFAPLPLIVRCSDVKSEHKGCNLRANCVACNHSLWARSISFSQKHRGQKPGRATSPKLLAEMRSLVIVPPICRLLPFPLGEFGPSDHGSEIGFVSPYFKGLTFITLGI